MQPSTKKWPLEVYHKLKSTDRSLLLHLCYHWMSYHTDITCQLAATADTAPWTWRQESTPLRQQWNCPILHLHGSVGSVQVRPSWGWQVVVTSWRRRTDQAHYNTDICMSPVSKSCTLLTSHCSVKTSLRQMLVMLTGDCVTIFVSTSLPSSKYCVIVTRTGQSEYLFSYR